MTYSNHVMIPGTYHSVSNDIYNGTDQEFASVPCHGSAFYQSVTSGSQTIQVSLINFEGVIQILATLDSDPITAEWSQVYEIGGDSTSLTTTLGASIPGNFCWLKAKVSNYTHGIINEMRITY